MPLNPPNPPFQSGPTPPGRSGRPWVITAHVLLLAAAYALLAYPGLRWGIVHGVGAPVWPAAGVALAGLLFGGARLWPGVLLGYLLAAALNGSPHAPWAITVVATGNTLAALAGWWMLRRLGFHPAMETSRDYILFLGAATLAAGVATAVGTFTLGVSFRLDAAGLQAFASHWFLGDLGGVLLVGTLLLAWTQARLVRVPGGALQFAGCLGLTAMVGAYVFLRQDERLYTFLGFVPLIWAALALRLRGASLACTMMALFGICGTALGYGPFSSEDLDQRYLDLQLFVVVMAVAIQVLAVVADERRAQKALMLSEARLKLALEASDTGLWKLDMATGAMSFSPECSRITGLGPRAFDGTRSGVVQLLHPDDQPGVRAAFRRAMETRGLFEAQFRLCRPDAGDLWIEARGRALYGSDGRAHTVLGTLTDVTERREAARRLADQARLLDLTTDGIYIRDLDGTISYWNAGAAAMYGYSADEAIGRKAWQLLNTEFPEPFGDIEARLHADDRWEGEIAQYRSDGGRLHVHARWVLTRDPEGRPQGVMHTNTDITTRKQAEETGVFLAELDRRIAQAGSADEVGDAGLALLGEHLRLLRCTLTDIDLDHGRIRTLHEWTDGAPRVFGAFDAREFFTTELGMALASGETVAVNDLRSDPLTAPFAANYLPYGTVALAAVSYVVEGRLTGTLTIASGRPRTWRAHELKLLREVVARLWPAIERARSVAALRESEARFRQMADTAPIMIYVTEPDGRCTYVSRRWSEFTGRMAEAELGFGWADVLHPDDRERVHAAFEAANDAQEAHVLEYRALRWDGAYRWMHATGRPRFGAGSEFLGFIGGILDITERREAEEALREADRRKDEFLATLAHELRNPLAPIRSGLHVLNLTADAEIARRTRQMMDRQLDHMVRLVDDLLDVSRITSGKVVLQRQRISLQDAVRAAIESARPSIESARHRLVVDLDEAPLCVDADPTRIAQVIGNLLTNAAKYTPDGGEVRLHAHACDGEACLSVTDTGLGIPPEAIGEVFGMFAQVNRTLDRAQGGLGIGLALARRLVEMHGGAIVAESAGLGQGSTFTVRLPLAAEAPAGDVAMRGDAPTPHARRVLVVDDNRDAAESLAMMLELEGHATRGAFSGADGLEVARGLGPDVAFLDLGMPGMNGYELARALRALPGLDGIYLVAVSGWGGEEDKRQSADAGFDLHLTKPVSVATVHDAMRRLDGVEAAAVG
ncbi:PAS domain S-box protein [Lysobacter humi (ex Lee et al. 2017)]